MTQKKSSTPPDSTAVERAFSQNAAAIKRFIARLLMNDQDVEDVAQEAFLKAYQAEKGKAIDQPKSFLFRIAQNLVISQIRQQRRRPTDYIEDLNQSGVVECMEAHSSAEEEAAAQQRLGIHCQAVAALSPQVRRVYLMRKVYGKSHKEIADELGIARSTVEKHLMKGVEMCDRYVREQLSQEQGSTVAERSQGGERL